MRLRSIRDLDVEGKRVVIRVDFNVPVREGRVEDATRIASSVPTIRFLLEQGARIALLAHRGQPKAERDDRYSLKPIVDTLATLLPSLPISFSSLLAVDDGAREVVDKLGNKEAVLFENVRFSPGETKNDPALAKRYAALGDLFVNDAFGTAHRCHASTVGIANLLPSYAGLLLAREVETLSRVLDKPKRPFVAIIGGAKISTKLAVIKELLKRCDFLLLGGALANTILKAQGVSVGKSLVEEHMIEIARELTLLDNRLRVPVDVIASQSVDATAPTRTSAVANIEDNEFILDIGPDTVKLYEMIIQTAGLVVWNGPMGVFEIARFSEGTKALAKVVAESRAESVVGGGETVDAIQNAGLGKKMSFLSTGGGAMLEFLEGKTLPGLEPLMVGE